MGRTEFLRQLRSFACLCGLYLLTLDHADLFQKAVESYEYDDFQLHKTPQAVL